jgi:hypothetical protein
MNVVEVNSPTLAFKSNHAIGNVAAASHLVYAVSRGAAQLLKP